MQQDLRNLFKKNEGISELPENHKDDFLVKLRASEKSSGTKVWFRYSYRIAAVLVLMAGVISWAILILNTEETEAQDTIVQQIESMEKAYLEDINREWKNFLILTTDKDLVQRYEKRLLDLDKDYQAVSKQFKEDTNDIATVENLISNLQTRLELLKDIQEHIKIINQQNESYENL